MSITHTDPRMTRAAAVDLVHDILMDRTDPSTSSYGHEREIAEQIVAQLLPWTGSWIRHDAAATG